MATGFSRSLSLLRQEKGISQRSAAADLGVSQALLSHYENGVREPGLDFVVRVCEYYNVSADFILGRTMSRDGTAIYANDLHDASTDKDNVLRGSILATLNKKLLNNAIGVIMDILGRSGDREVISEASGYLSASVYKIFRNIYMAYGKNPDSFFPVSSKMFAYVADAEMKLMEMRLVVALNSKEQAKSDNAKYPELSHDALTRDYPLLAQSLFSVIQSFGDRIKKYN